MADPDLEQEDEMRQVKKRIRVELSLLQTVIKVFVARKMHVEAMLAKEEGEFDFIKDYAIIGNLKGRLFKRSLA